MKVVFCKIKESISSASQSQVFNPSSFSPNKSDVDFGLHFPQPPSIKESKANNFNEFDTLTGKMKGTYMLSGGARGPTKTKDIKECGITMRILWSMNKDDKSGVERGSSEYLTE